MTMLYVYGIVDSPHFSGDLIGHEGAAVIPVADGNLSAATSMLAGMLALRPENIWKHEQVLEALMRQHAVLPLRFGTLAGDGAVLCEELRRRRPVLLADFDRVRGKVEFALRVTNIAAQPTLDLPMIDNDAASLTPGAHYLRAKAAVAQARDTRGSAARAVEHMLRQKLDPLSAGATWDVATDGPARLTASYLVGRNAGVAFVEAVARIRAHHPALDVGCTGPWAPYSFVTAGGVEDRQ